MSVYMHLNRMYANVQLQITELQILVLCITIDTTVSETNAKVCSKCNTEKEMTCFERKEGGFTKRRDACRAQNKIVGIINKTHTRMQHATYT